MLFHVYKEEVPEGHYLNEPHGIYRTLLDADWLMYILLPLILVIIVAAMMYAWRLHEMPSHKAQHKKMRQAELVSGLTLIGMFMHWVWVIAFIIAYVDWDAVEEFFTRVLRNSRAAPPAPAAAAALPPAPPEKPKSAAPPAPPPPAAAPKGDEA